MLVLLGLLAAAGIGLGIWAIREIPEEPAVPVRQEHGGSLLRYDPEEILRMTIRIRGREAWTAERDASGAMRMTEDADWPLEEDLAGRMEDALANLLYEEVLTENPEEYRNRLEEFGLADPEITADALFADGTDVTIRIGNRIGGDEDLRFMTVEGDPRLFAVAGSLAEELSLERELLHPVEQPLIQASRLDRVTVMQKEEKKAEWRLQGEITDSGAAENWQVAFPVNYPADQDRIASLKKNVDNLRLGVFVAEEGEDALRETGLDAPRYTLEIHLAPGTTGHISESGAYEVQEQEEETFLFRIGGARNEMTDYCLFDHAIYSINHFTVAALCETEPMDTLARYPVSVSLENLRSLEICGADGREDRYELTWNTGDSEDPGILFSCRKNGEDISAAAFSAAYERWRVTDVSGRLPEGWQRKTPFAVYRFTTLNGQKHEVELSEFDGMHDAVTVDGCTVFYLIRGGLADLP